MSEFNKYRKEITVSLFTIFPFILLANLAEFIVEEGIIRSLIKIALGCLGGLIGFVIYRIVKSKTQKIIIITFSALLIFLILFVRLVYELNKLK